MSESEDGYSDNTLDSDPDEEIDLIVKSASRISSDVHQVLRINHPVNLVYSPFGLSSLLGVTKFLSKGDASEEIVKAMNFPTDDQSIVKGFGAIFSSILTKSKYISVIVSQKVFLQSDYAVKEQVKDTLRIGFNSDVESIDFVRDHPLKNSIKINSILDEATKGKVKDVVSSDNIDSKFTRLLLVNAVCFQGTLNFKTVEISTRKFYLDAQKSVDVEMMKSKKSKFLYGFHNKLESRVVVLPYKGDRLSMILFIPCNRVGLEKIETDIKSLQPSSYLLELHDQRKKLSENTYIQVTIPTFKIQSTVHLEQPFKQLGINVLCQPGVADFSGLSDDAQGLFVYNLIQTAVVELNSNDLQSTTDSVNYTECENNDITGVSGIETIECIADRPFYFQVIDHSLDLIILSGSFVNPLPEFADQSNPIHYVATDLETREDFPSDSGLDTETTETDVDNLDSFASSLESGIRMSRSFTHGDLVDFDIDFI